MKLIEYFENLNNLTQTVNPELINFIDQKIPKGDYILYITQYFQSKLEIIFDLPTIDFMNSIIQRIAVSKTIQQSNKGMYVIILNNCVNNLKIIIKEYISNIETFTNIEFNDPDFKKENLDYAKLILFNAYCINKIVSTIIQKEPITEDEKQSFKKIINITLSFFEKKQSLLEMFDSNLKGYFTKVQNLIQKTKINPIIFKISKENKADKEKNKILKNKQVYYFKCIDHENRQYHVIPVNDSTFDSKNETYYDFVIQQGEENGVWNFLDSPLNNAFIGMKFNKILFDKLNQEEDKMNILNKIYLINDPKSLNILENDNRIKKISISGAKNFKLKFQPNDANYILPNIKVGVLKVE